MVHPYSKNDTPTVWKKLRFTLLDRSDFLIIDNLPTAVHVHAFTCRLLISFSVDETFLLKYVSLSIDFSEPPFCVEMSPFCLIQIMQQGFGFAGEFARSAMSSA